MFVNDYGVPHDLLNFNLEFQPVELSKKVDLFMQRAVKKDLKNESKDGFDRNASCCSL